MKRRRVIHVKHKARSVLSTRRRAQKKSSAASITARSNVFRMNLIKEVEAEQAEES